MRQTDSKTGLPAWAKRSEIQLEHIKEECGVNVDPENTFQGRLSGVGNEMERKKIMKEKKNKSKSESGSVLKEEESGEEREEEEMEMAKESVKRERKGYEKYVRVE